MNVPNRIQPRVIEVRQTADAHAITYVNTDHITHFRGDRDEDGTQFTVIFMTNGIGLHVAQTADVVSSRIEGFQDR
jgi:hypothetical protein